MSTLHARKAALGFKGYEDFQPVLTAARLAARAELGFRWDLSPECRWARLPAKWCRAPIFGRIAKCPRDQKLPPARFWPNGQFPVGAEMAANPKPAAYFCNGHRFATEEKARAYAAGYFESSRVVLGIEAA